MAQLRIPHQRLEQLADQALGMLEEVAPLADAAVTQGLPLHLHPATITARRSKLEHLLRVATLCTLVPAAEEDLIVLDDEDLALLIWAFFDTHELRQHANPSPGE